MGSKLLVGLVSALLLVGCGGGGGGPSSSVAPAAQPAFTTVDAAAAWATLLHGNRTFTASGTGSDGKSYSLSYSISSGTGGSFGGVSGDTATFTSLMKQGTTDVATSSTTLFLTPGTSNIYGVWRPSDSRCLAVTGGTAPGSAADLHQVGTLYAGEVLPCSAPGVTLETWISTWSVETEGQTAYFCVNSTDQQAVLVPTSSACVEVDASGKLGSHVRFDLNDGNGFTITMR